jgi:hypothetical protein
MGYPNVENKTGFAFEPVFAADNEAKPLLVAVVKATFQIEGSEKLKLAEKQLPVNLAGQYWGDPDSSSYKYEPEGAIHKPATDLALIGHAYGEPNRSHVLVNFQVGPVQKTARVTGDRYWIRTFGVIWKTSPKPFDKIPLVYERAFGGWDRTPKNPKKHRFEPRNPVGTAYRTWSGKFEEGVQLPNIEHPRQGLQRYHQKPPPVGFGFTAPHWHPRARFAGTYNEQWQKLRMPALPKDFDFRYFNGASSGLTVSGFLRGDEPVLVENASSERRLHFRLPGVPPPRLQVELRGGTTRPVQTVMDTVIVNTDERLLLLIWRGRLQLRRGPEDVVAMKVGTSP